MEQKKLRNTVLARTMIPRALLVWYVRQHIVCDSSQCSDSFSTQNFFLAITLLILKFYIALYNGLTKSRLSGRVL